MKNVENENEDLMMSQLSLLEKVQKINKLFKIHFASLSLFLIISITSTIFLILAILTGQFFPTLVQRYKLVGTIFNGIQFVVLFLILFVFICHILIYFSFVIRGNRSIKKIEKTDSDDGNLQSIFHHGIVSYVNHILTFFKRYSKDKKKLSDLVTIFLFIYFFLGYWIIFLYSSLGGIGDSKVFGEPFSVILFLAWIISWLVSFGMSFKIRKKILLWEKIIPKLDTWAHELEELPSNTSNKSEILEDE